MHGPVMGGAGGGFVDGESVAREASARVVHSAVTGCARTGQPVVELLYETLYREQRRLAENTTKPGANSDRAFLDLLRRGLQHADSAAQGAWLRRVVERYASEVCGRFDPRVYGFATRVLPPMLSTLLHGGRPSAELFQIDDRVLLEGAVEPLQAAAQRGTVVLAPTHFSNLDSLVLGYAIYRLGLAPFAYGAGLNLFSNPLTSFFMHHLGAFTVDREKTDPLYLETVKEYAGVLLERGQHLLFFPGGTRSRSGAVEHRLKLGFLGRAVAAYRRRCAHGAQARPVFVVPCTLTYPLVLEASSLIGEYLRREGGPRFFDVQDESAQIRRWLAFLRGLSELDVRVHVRFGRPLDPFGNAVDAEGGSLDRRGRRLDSARYLWRDGAIADDPARDEEYTRVTADAVLDAYRRDTVVMPSAVLAHCLFAHLRKSYRELDLFRFLRAVATETRIPMASLSADVRRTLEEVQHLATRGRCVLDPALRSGGVDAVLGEGRRTLQTYHRDPAVLRGDGEAVAVTNPTLLLYYRNRLAGLGLSDDGPPSRLSSDRSGP